ADGLRSRAPSPAATEPCRSAGRFSRRRLPSRDTSTRRCAAAETHSETGRHLAAEKSGAGLTSVNRLRLFVHVVHQDVLTECIRRREVRLALADLGDAP